MGGQSQRAWTGAVLLSLVPPFWEPSVAIQG